MLFEVNLNGELLDDDRLILSGVKYCTSFVNSMYGKQDKYGSVPIL